MNSTIKLILGLTAGAFMLCLCAAVSGLFLLRSTGSVLGRALQTDADQVVEVSASIAEYNLPSGFGEAYTTQLAGFSLVSYTGDDGHSHIYFFQLPAGVHMDPDEIERRLQETAGDQDRNWDVSSEVVDQVPATICSQEVTLVISEGVNHDGQSYRQVSGMFQGKGGQALVVFERPVASWDQAEVDAFIASIH